MPFFNRPWFPLVFAAALALSGSLISTPIVDALDLTGGHMFAVPVPNGPPAFDGTGKGWDLSAAEPLWVSTQMAKEMHASVALNYDADNLYVYAKISLPNRKLSTPGGPADTYWVGDGLEMHLCTDPALPTPLSLQKPEDGSSPRIFQIHLWKNTLDGTDHIYTLCRGIYNTPTRKVVFDPPGSKIKVTEGDNEYVIEAQLPWAALNVPDGKNPFKPGSDMTGTFEVHWRSGTYFTGVPALYVTNPGDFEFRNWGTWGRVEFSPTGNLKPQHETMEQALAASVPGKPEGVPVTVDVPDAGKISVDIVDGKGGVIRELTGGREVKAGKFTTYWDGRDQWGFVLKPGTYQWGAYFSHGLKARLTGYVGSSGNPPWPTPDGLGGWGGDHGLPDAVAADASGIYLGWTGAEAQALIVKIDYDGNTKWRKSPFVQGGWASVYALASNGKYLFAIYNGIRPELCRLDPKTGFFVLFGSDVATGSVIPLKPGVATTDDTGADLVKPPAGSLPAEGGVLGMGRSPKPYDGDEPDCLGVAATEKEVFAAIYSQNIIQVLDAETGKLTRTLACPRPRGLALDSKGNLYAVNFGTDAPAQVVRFDGVRGSARPVITANLTAPVGVAVDASGRITVTDEGASQQIKTFSATGKLVRTLGGEGGRPWAGAYDPASYRDPYQVVADPRGGLVVAESSIPKIFDRIDAASGKTLARWFGAAGYGVENTPDPEDPMTNYYPFEPEGFARATVPTGKMIGLPDAYWVPSKAGMDGVGTLFGETFPCIKILANGRKYFIADANPHAVCLIEGDTIRPVGHLDAFNTKDRRRPETKTPYIEMWIDSNGDRKVQPGELTTIDTVGGKPLPNMSQGSGTMWMDRKGNAFLITAANSILEIPSDGFAKNGAILWNPAKAFYPVPVLIPSKLKALGTFPRSGAAGIRTDSAGNFYTCITTTVPSLTPALAAQIQGMYPDIPQSQWCAYSDAGLAKRLHEGLGHTSESNAVKFVKYGPDGKMLWIAGRKATAAPNPGEMYHTWSFNDLIGDSYVSMCSEWGVIYFYTSDGYYVDSMMNDPATLAEAGPYTFGSENFSGHVQAFAKLGKVFAFDQGGIYAVEGFDANLKVSGEQRFKGTVVLDKTCEGLSQEAVAATPELVPLSGDIATGAAWSAAPVVTLMNTSGAPLATAQLGYDKDNVYAKIHVIDDTPPRNGGGDPNVVFKSGDVVGLDLGPAGDRNNPGSGDVRILAARMQGRNRLIGMKPRSAQAKQPQQYITPASGTKSLDFVGDIPGGKAVLAPDGDNKGYTALLTIPRSFLEFPVTPGVPIKGDIEVLLSGIKSQGLQAVSRNWLFSGGHVQTTMTDDIPTEAWLYPQFWGGIKVK